MDQSEAEGLISSDDIFHHGYYLYFLVKNKLLLLHIIMIKIL